MQKGKLIKWNDEKGFGFIRPENSEEEIFFHISSLQRASRRPIVGDSLYFNVAADEMGRNKAKNVNLEGVKSVFAERGFGKAAAVLTQNKQVRPKSSRPHQYYRNQRQSRSIVGISIVILVIVVTAGISQINKKYLPENASVAVNYSAEEEANFASQFECEGKTRCSQMTSCEEAMFYLNNCPGSVTDGDGDGRPCEDQWCGH